MIKLLHNCPNCGAPLQADGYCQYCKTKIRYANELEVKQIDRYSQEPMEILLKVKQGDQTIIYPIKGQLSSISIDYYGNGCAYGSPFNDEVTFIKLPPSISFTVDGYIDEIEKGEEDG